MADRFVRRVWILPLLLLVAVLPISTHAQSLGPDDEDQLSEPSGRAPATSGRSAVILPYVEVEQVLTTQNLPENETFTYTRVAAGLDGSVSGINNGVSMSLRYERRFGWGHDEADGDTISGIVNGYATVIPGVQIQAGALATRSKFGSSDLLIPGAVVNDDVSTQVYSAYAGPVVATRAGDVDINASYRIGYTKVEQDEADILPASGWDGDRFDDSVSQMAGVSAAVAPYTVLPVGLGVSSTWYREDISNLDQRVEDFQISAMVTVPVSQTVAFTGGIGYEDVEVSSRDALRDENGLPIIGSGGNYVTDKSSPRVIAYDTEGLIWDVGVMWRPSRRTELTASVGRRYGSTSVTGTFSYAPNSRSSLGVVIYDDIAGYGGQINRALQDLPTAFTAVRDPITGEITGCVNSLDDNDCLSGALGPFKSSAFRASGIAANYTYRFGWSSAGIGMGYDRRTFIGAQDTILASADGVVDENYWMAAFFTAGLNELSTLQTNIYANLLDGGGEAGGTSKSWGITTAYYRDLTERLTARAALGVEGASMSEAVDDFWTASALVGVRYNF